MRNGTIDSQRHNSNPCDDQWAPKHHGNKDADQRPDDGVISNLQNNCAAC
jgi:hypothetical protein